ncbi:hypothetical protein D3C80_1835210 [compost metagenome]
MNRKQEVLPFAGEDKQAVPGIEVEQPDDMIAVLDSGSIAFTAGAGKGQHAGPLDIAVG